MLLTCNDAMPWQRDVGEIRMQSYRVWPSFLLEPMPRLAERLAKEPIVVLKILIKCCSRNRTNTTL